MENRGYSVSIASASRELTKQQRIALKDTADCVRLDEATKDGKVTIHPDYYVILDVHNEKASGDKDYRQYIIADVDGTKYLTGSTNLFNSFKDIDDEMEGEAYEIEVIRRPSKNYKGKDFLSCRLI